MDKFQQVHQELLFNENASSQKTLKILNKQSLSPYGKNEYNRTPAPLRYQVNSPVPVKSLKLDYTTPRVLHNNTHCLQFVDENGNTKNLQLSLTAQKPDSEGKLPHLTPLRKVSHAKSIHDVAALAN
jgi:hypothetical protein